MTRSLTTWDALPPASGSVLLVVNAAEGDTASAQGALDVLGGWAGRDAVHAVAGAAWRDWLGMEGISAERALLAQDEQGRDVELTHFLHTSIALPWIAARHFVAVMGVQPHNLHNEEVQDIFEGQLSLLLGDGRLLAHTLPSPYVYVFDTDALVHRYGRDHAVQTYRRQALGLLDSLHEAWVAQGSPPNADVPDYGDVLPLLARHLDSSCLQFDEDAPWPGELVLPVPARAVAARLRAVCELIGERDRRLAAFEALLAERNQAVELRDRLLNEERQRYARTLDAHVRRGLGRIRRLLRGA